MRNALISGKSIAPMLNLYLRRQERVRAAAYRLIRRNGETMILRARRHAVETASNGSRRNRIYSWLLTEMKNQCGWPQTKAERD